MYSVVLLNTYVCIRIFQNLKRAKRVRRRKGKSHAKITTEKTSEKTIDDVQDADESKRDAEKQTDTAVLPATLLVTRSTSNNNKKTSKKKVVIVIHTIHENYTCCFKI